MKQVFFLIFLFLVSCSHSLKPLIDYSHSYEFVSQTVSLHNNVGSLRSAGSLSIETENGSFSGSYEVAFLAPEKWRFSVKAPFHIDVATIIIDGDKVSMFEDGRWQEIQWAEVSRQIFDLYLPLFLLSYIFETPVDETMMCDGRVGEKICKKGEFLFLFGKEGIREIGNGVLIAQKRSMEWVIVADEARLEIEEDMRDSNVSLSPLIFDYSGDGDLFDEL